MLFFFCDAFTFIKLESQAQMSPRDWKCVMMSQFELGKYAEVKETWTLSTQVRFFCRSCFFFADGRKHWPVSVRCLHLARAASSAIVGGRNVPVCHPATTARHGLRLCRFRVLFLCVSYS